MIKVIAWVLAASLSWLPVPGPTQPSPFGGLALHDETASGYLLRRESIARDTVAVAFDPSEAPLFDGPNGRAETALYLSSIQRFESGYDLLVDNGKIRGPGGEVCLNQVMVDAGRRNGEMVTAEGWTKADLLADRRKCVRAALHKLRVSKSICSDAKHAQNATKKALTGADAFSIYMTGRCVEGSRYAAHRYDLARKWLASNPAP